MLVEHGVYKYLFLNVKENEISVYLNCKKVDIFFICKILDIEMDENLYF